MPKFEFTVIGYYSDNDQGFTTHVEIDKDEPMMAAIVATKKLAGVPVVVSVIRGTHKELIEGSETWDRDALVEQWGDI